MGSSVCMQRRQRRVSLRRVFPCITVITVILCTSVNYVGLHRRQITSYHKQVPTQIDTDALFHINASERDSTSSSCDNECRGFRVLLDAWPADKPKAAVILLLGPSSDRTFAVSSHLFDANFNDLYHYPVIVFLEENINSHDHRKRLRSLTNSSLYFQVRWLSLCPY